MKKRFASLGLTLLFFVSYGLTGYGFGVSGMAAAAPEAIDLSDYENGQVLVCYTDGGVEVLSYDSGDALAQGLAALAQDEAVALFQPNYIYSGAALSTDDALSAQQWALSNDGSFRLEERENPYPVYDSPFEMPFAPGQWTMPGGSRWPGGLQGTTRGSAYGSASLGQTAAVAGIDINAEEAWALYEGGSREVVVALIDTGIDFSHEDLGDAAWVNQDEVAGNGVDDDGNGYIDDVHGWNFYHNSSRVYAGASEDSHGTHGAGTIAASAGNGVGIAGIVNSDNVKIMSLKALGGRDGSGSTASVVKAIQYAEANGASICNLSLGSEANDRALYQAMASSSMLFVVAAGNDGADTDQTPSYPASYGLDNIISVASLNCDGTLHDSSNYGASSVDLAAPGVHILSATPNNGYGYMTGTSMSAPMVTAAAAMVYSHYEDITLADVKDILLSSARTLDSLEGKTLTGGMLDLGAAMAYDLGTLSGREWDAPIVDDGCAPVITVEQSSWQGRTVLTVRVADADGDLTAAAYASGERDAAYFKGGTAGRRFYPDRNGQARFIIYSGGQYTFYACDSAGNETAVTVSVGDG